MNWKQIPYSAFRGIEYILFQHKLGWKIYWHSLPTIYRLSYSIRYRQYGAPINPLKPIEVSPRMMIRVTGRKNPSAYHRRRKSLGKIQDGDWDKNTSSTERSYDSSILEGIFFEEKIFYRGIQQRYKENYDWESTVLYQSLQEYLEKPNTTWRGIENPHEMEDYLQSIDQLYESIAENGYKKQTELKKQNRTNHFGVIDLLVHEIVVDIGRDGEILIVDGKHRLAISKVLNLESVPVTVLVRHKKWMEYRDEVWTDPDKDASWHPDLIQPE